MLPCFCRAHVVRFISGLLLALTLCAAAAFVGVVPASAQDASAQDAGDDAGDASALRAERAAWVEGFWRGAYVRANSVMPVRMWFERTDAGDLVVYREHPDWVYEGRYGPDPVRIDARGRVVLPEARYGPVELNPDTTYQEMIGQSGGGTPAAHLHLKRAVEPPPTGVTEETVVIASGGVDLAGAVYLPRGDGPHAGVVLNPGGRGCSARYVRARLARTLAEYGIAALAYDQRGAGESEGDCATVSFETVVDDALAAYRTLQARPEVDVGRVGLWGSSAGSWWSQGVADRLLDQGEAPAFMISWWGMGTSIRAVQRAVKTTRMREAGYDEEALQDVLHVIDVARDTTMSDRAIYDELQALKAKGDAAGWSSEAFSVSTFPDTPAAVDSLWWQRFRFEPAPVLRRLSDVPYLAINGRDDPLVPYADNVPRLRRLLHDAGNDAVRTMGVDAVGHGASNGDRFRELPGSVLYYKFQKVMPVFLQETLAFLRRHDEL